MIEIIPAILPHDFREVEDKASQVASLVSRVQVDIVDGVFAPQKTWPFTNDHGEFVSLVKEERGLPQWESLSYEIDMMVADPARLFDEWVAVGASALIVHRESLSKGALDDIFLRSEERTIDIGIALKPKTDIADIEAWIEKAAFIQCMGSNTIGQQGTALDESVYEKISDIHARFPQVTISVDIGVNRMTAPKLIASGATKLVSGSAIFGSESVRESIDWFQLL